MKRLFHSRFVSVLAVSVLTLSLTACGKSVSKRGSSFSQTEPPAETLPEPGTPSMPNPPGDGTSPVACDPSIIAPLLSYSIYTKDDVSLSGVKLRKRVAGSDACITGAEIARAFPADRSRADLVVSHDLTLSSVKIAQGKVLYGRSLESKKSTTLGGMEKVSGIDLSREWANILAFSGACAATAANSAVEKVCVNPPNGPGNDSPNGPGGDSPNDPPNGPPNGPAHGLGLSAGNPVCTLYITGSDAKLNVASLSLSHLAGVRFITIDIPAGATFVGNFAKLRSTTLSGVEVRLVRSYSPDRIFWNLPVSEKLAFTQTKFLGTVVSPQADVGICGNEGAGAFWAESVQASNSVW